MMPCPENTLIAATFGLLWGLFIATLAVMLSDSGRGWNAALLFGMVSIVMSPVACVLWVKKETTPTHWLILSIIIALTADIGLLQASWSEGFYAFQQTVDRSIAWLILWVSWQYLLLLSLLDRKDLSRNI